MVTVDRLRTPLRRAKPVALVVAGAAIGALLVIAFGGGNTTGVAPTSAGALGSAAGGTGGMSGMSGMGTGTASGASAASADGVKAVPTQVLGTATWQGMKITADAMTPVPFLVDDGTSMREVKPPANVSFHLMVLLNDAQTDVVIPYATVWATITKGTAMPFDDRLWPMISRYMGPHYGDDVSLPGAGTYTLSLLVSPPVSARHLEYQNVWLKPHTVTFTFHWKPAS